MPSGKLSNHQSINLLNADERKQQGYVLVETKQTVESDKLNFNLDLLFMCATVVCLWAHFSLLGTEGKNNYLLELF